MEELPHSSPEKSDEPTTEKKKHSPLAEGGFLRSWIARMQGSEFFAAKNAENQEKEDTPEGKKKKRLRKLLGKVFGSIVESQPVPEKKKRSEGLFASFEPVRDSAAAPGEANEQTSDTTEPDQTEDRIGIPHIEQQSEGEDSQQKSEAEDSSETAAMHPEATPDEPAGEAAPATHAVEAGVIHLHDTERQARAAAEASPVFERAAVPAQKEAYYVNNRRAEAMAASALVLGGAEVLRRRHHDKEIKNEVRTVEKRLEKQAAATEQLAGQREALQRKVDQAAEELRQKRSIATTSAPEVAPPLMHTPQERAVPRQAQEERQGTLTAHLKPEQAIVRPEVTEVSSERISEPASIREIIQSRYESVQPEEVLHTVEQAAEKNIPLENVYERRHEIKDQTDNDMRDQWNAAFADASRRTQATGQQLSPMAHLSTNAVPSSDTHQPQQGIYKKAVIGGLWGAVVLLVMIFVLAVTR